MRSFLRSIVGSANKEDQKSVNQSTDMDDRKEDAQSEVIEIFSNEVTDFSSQYGSETSISYTANNLSGQSSIYPNYGDFTQACVFRTYGPWWDNIPSSRKPFTRTPPSFCSQDYIELSFAVKVFPQKLLIYETYNPGCIVRILACDTGAGTDVDTGRNNSWKVLWEGSPEKAKYASRVFCPEIIKCPFPTNLIRLEFCHRLAHYYTELDAVKLIGTKHPTSNLQTATGDVIHLPYQEMENLSLKPSVNEVLSSNTQGAENSVLNKGENPTLTKADNLEMVANYGNASEYTNVSTDPVSDNGHFDLLPGEVIQLILSFLDHLSLCRVARTSSLLHKHCYDSLQYTELNLQPHWTQVTDLALDSLLTRCQHLQRLNLSWCHGNLLSHQGFCRFIEACGTQLTGLYLSSCSFLKAESITEIVRNCPNITELDLDSCQKIESVGLRQLKNLVHLRRLNLYRTYVDYFAILAIIRACKELQHLNLGSCTHIRSLDDVVIELSQNCRNLRSLDLWRNRTISDIAILALAECCTDLEELDLGWCSDLKSNSNCFIVLAQKCRKMKKLYLTANRTVCDADLEAIAQYSADLEQLDILGTREVSADAAQKVLENCKHLVMFDVSFCSGIDFVTVQNWEKEFPNVAIKKSFQN